MTEILRHTNNSDAIFNDLLDNAQKVQKLEEKMNTAGKKHW